MKTYRAGNWLRGFFEGEFSSIEEAWSYLSKRFIISFPTNKPDGQRHIYMSVKDNNKFGFNQYLQCKVGYTELNNLTKEEVINKCSVHINQI